MMGFMVAENTRLDYQCLRQEGMRLLEALAGEAWTDFNEHDPGITILEQYCYALSELAYRCNFSIPDLLSSGGKKPAASLHSPATILSTRPVTLTDLRKLALDVEGVNNAWIEKVDLASPQVFFDRYGASTPLDPQKQLIVLKAGEGLEPVKLKGLYRVLLQPSPAADSAVIRAVSAKVGQKLHAHRPLGMDFVSVEVMEPHNIQVNASIEIGPFANADDILSAIQQKLATHIAPSVPVYTLAQRLAAGLPIEEIFDGPRLEHGFIDTGELLRRERKTALQVSDLVREIMDVKGVLLVKHLALNGKDWWLDVEAGKTPVFDRASSVLRLERQQIEVLACNANSPQAQASLALPKPKPEDLDMPAPVGRDRRVGRYYSAQHQFPAVYGLGEKGLPPGSDTQRQAQIKQLKAYLLFFDQLLANQFAQLAHVGDLLGFAENPQHTYFAHFIDDSSLGLDGVWREPDAEARRQRLECIVENPDSNDSASSIDWSRKNGFLDHLLARFAEHFTDYAQFQSPPNNAGLDPKQRLAQAKQAWLRQYPELSAARGTGYNIMPAEPLETYHCAGLELRLRHKLGLKSGEFYLVEHVLLRPVDADLGQQATPLLKDARCADPYSLQISLVFECKEQNDNFGRFVEQTVREETPAHLTVYVCWLNELNMALFGTAYHDWIVSLGSYSSISLQDKKDEQKKKDEQQNKDEQQKKEASFRLRDARDRLIDLLKIGRTYPLVDLPVEYTQMVAWGMSGTLTLSFSQPGVAYQLLDRDGKPLNPEVNATGNGSDLVLTTPKITNDIHFTVKAVKNSLALTLHRAIEIKVGLDKSLQAAIVGAAPLDPNATTPTPTDPRIVNYGASPQVQIEKSQAGVDYYLVCAKTGPAEIGDYELGDPKTTWKVISTRFVRGDSLAIMLQTQPMAEDTDIRILAIKTFDASEKQAEQRALLTITLPLKVRANPALAVTANLQGLDYAANAAAIIQGSQTSVSYQLFFRPIRDSEFVRDGTESSALLTINGITSLWVKKPSNPTTDAITALGVATAGNGGDLSLTVGGLKEDSLLVVVATKQHTTQSGKPAIPSSLQLAQAVAVLVKPEPAGTDYPLRLQAKTGAASTDGLNKEVVYSVLNGQPGVFYHFRLANSALDLGLPVYCHKDGKGIDELLVEVDFVVTGSLPSPLPEWDCPVDLTATATLSIRAVKAQTGLESVFERTVGVLLATT